MKVKVIADKKTLARIWNADYAKNSGKTLNCLRLDDEGWAVCEKWKFPPNTFEVVEE